MKLIIKRLLLKLAAECKCTFSKMFYQLTNQGIMSG